MKRTEKIVFRVFAVIVIMAGLVEVGIMVMAIVGYNALK